MDLINCISAESLRNMQREYTDEKCQEQLKAIGKKLEEVAREFRNYLYVDSIYPTVQKELEELGYTVSNCSSQKDGPCYCIKW